MAHTRSILGLALALIASQAARASPPTLSEPLIPTAQRTSAPPFTLTDVHGHPLSLARYHGRVVLLDFWAIVCGGCKVELPWYVGFNSKYHPQGLSVVGLDMYGDPPAAIRSFMRKQQMTYRVAVGTDALGAKFGLTAMPLTLLIDRHGRIAVSHTGIVDRTAFEADIQQLLHE